MVKAKWIWKKQKDYNPYNQVVVARKLFRLGDIKKAVIKITADSFYRLYINDTWVNDGPARSWPEHMQYDEIDVTWQMQNGENEIRVIAQHSSTASFQRIPVQAGLLVQLEITQENGKQQLILSDKTWEIANAKAWCQNTSPACFQVGPTEWYDARLEKKLRFSPAAELYDSTSAPWKGLTPRSSALMTKQPVAFKTFKGANVVNTDAVGFCVAMTRLFRPGTCDSSMNKFLPFAIASVLTVEKKQTITIYGDGFGTNGFKVYIDGKHNASGRYTLSAGQHLVLATVPTGFSFHQEATLLFHKLHNAAFENPLKPEHENPWCYVPFKQYTYQKPELMWRLFTNTDEDAQKLFSEYEAFSAEVGTQSKDRDTFIEVLGKHAQCIASEDLFVENSDWQFRYRTELGDAAELVQNPAGLMYDNPELTVVQPSDNGDVELVYDLGEQNCGYFRFDVIADAGVSIDIYGIEYISENGTIQHTLHMENGMRYITKEGVNRFTSLKRRSGRYIFITLRNQKTPVTFRVCELIESTYPVHQFGSFTCSDDRLSRIWDIAARTLKLCMEDVFTDCPLYEQVFWIGDARNEYLFSYGVFGAYDLAQRCLELTAQSLERYPLVSCMVPCDAPYLIPAFSFMWAMSVWEYYWHTGDTAFLKKMWKPLIKNLKGAETYLNENGLFTSRFWNLCDTADIDQDQPTVLYNSIMYVAAIDAVLRCAGVLKDKTQTTWLKTLRKNLCSAINDMWDDDINAFHDSIRADGAFGYSISQHTHFASVLYDIINTEHYEQAVKNTLEPPEQMEGVAFPMNLIYLLETFEKLGREDMIIKEIYERYVPMLNMGSTTVWEVFPNSAARFQAADFFTRSHCHAGSAAPLYFLPRVILGLKQSAPAGRSFELSPQLSNLTSAQGTLNTINGPVHIAWQLDGNELHITFNAPKGVRIKFKTNDSLQGLQIRVNKKRVS